MVKKIIISLIKLYQLSVSPDKGFFISPKPTCRFSPTCSEYFIESLEAFSVAKGSWLGIKRIIRCHPWGKSGYDPVPKSNK